jgi:branched-chain amino acid aminotransferase
MARKVFFNGKFVNEFDAKISIYDSALMFGDMVFEMTRSFNHKQFLLEDHIDRLLTGLKILRIPIKYNKKQILKICEDTIKKNSKYFKKDDEHRLMIDVSRGLLDIYKGIKNIHKDTNFIVADFPLRWTVRGMGKLFNTGINAVITSQRAIPSMYMDPKIKNRSRLFYLNANIEASLFKGKNNWALLLDDRGFIAEGSGDNFFIIKDKKVITPRGVHILRGISRDYVLEDLCEQLNLEKEEKDIEPYDVYSADEAFMTGTPFCMLPVTSLNNIKIGKGKRGKIFNILLSTWSKNVGIDIEKQIKKWNSVDNKKKNNKFITPYNFK